MRATLGLSEPPDLVFTGRFKGCSRHGVASGVQLLSGVSQIRMCLSLLKAWRFLDTGKSLDVTDLQSHKCDESKKLQLHIRSLSCTFRASPHIS